MNNQWWNKYIGIPYTTEGRERDSGLDCWGLVRLVYKEELGIDLPTFTNTYHDTETQAEALAFGKEYWDNIEAQESGDVVIFRIAGEASHVGIITIPGFFIHVREGQDSVVESLDSIKWRKRIEGIYRYANNTLPAVITGRPNPLNTQNISEKVPLGSTVLEAIDFLRKNHSNTLDINVDGIVFINGKLLPKEEWSTYVPSSSDRVEYKALLRGGSVGRLFATIAIAWIAFTIAPYIVGMLPGGAAATATAAGIGFGGLSYGASLAIVSGAINMVGGLLMNAIFPTRPPSI